MFDSLSVDAYAQPNERRVGSNRPMIKHSPAAAETRTRQERLKEKQAVAAERRRIKKSARRHLQRDLQERLREDPRGPV
jgi:hypothetical protein